MTSTAKGINATEGKNVIIIIIIFNISEYRSPSPSAARVCRPDSSKNMQKLIIQYVFRWLVKI